jgi:predicted transcriptional regulator
MSVTMLELTPDTKADEWIAEIKERLSRGEHAYVRFEQPYVTPAQMADSIGISRQAIMRWIGEGRIVTSRHGNRHHILPREVERFRRWYIQDIADLSRDNAMADLFGEQ